MKPEELTLEQAVEILNQHSYAGFSDWKVEGSGVYAGWAGYPGQPHQEMQPFDHVPIREAVRVALSHLQEEEIRRLQQEVHAYEEAQAELIAERDLRLEQIDSIADTLGDDSEWTNLNDRGIIAIGLTETLTGRLEQQKEEIERLELRIEDYKRGLLNTHTYLGEHREENWGLISKLQSELEQQQKKVELLDELLAATRAYHEKKVQHEPTFHTYKQSERLKEVLKKAEEL